jgi:hypothetical protein
MTPSSIPQALASFASQPLKDAARQLLATLELLAHPESLRPLNPA